MTGQQAVNNNYDYIVNFIKTVGFPIFVAIILLGMFLGVIPSRLEKIDMNVSTGLEKQTGHIDESRNMAKLLRAICRNTAKSELQIRDCD